MRKIAAIIWKDTALRFASPAEWLFFLILPIVFTFLLAGGAPSGSEDPRIRLTVVDLAGTSLSSELLNALEDSTAVQPVKMSLQEAETQFEQRQVSSLLVIPGDFNIEQLQMGAASLEFRQQPNNLNAQVAGRAVQIAIQRTSSAVQIALNAVQQAESFRPFETITERQAYFDQSLQSAQMAMAKAPARFEVIQAEDKNPIYYDPAVNASAGQLITWVFIPLLGLSGMFAFERQQGTLRRLLTTPTERATFLLATILGQVLTALIQISLLIFFGMLVLKINWGHDLAGLAAIMVSFTFAASAMGTTLGTFIKSEGQASGLSIMLGMVMALLGGCWYPLEMFPEFVRSLVHILPTTWAMQGILALILRGQTLVQILPQAGVLIGFAVLFFVIGIWRFHYE